MKTLLFTLTFIGFVFAQAASNYSCTVENKPGATIEMVVSGGGMKVSVDGEEKSCGIDESATTLQEVNADLKKNLDIVFDAEVVITCDASTADGIIMYFIGKKNIEGTPTNTVVSNPVVGPMSLSRCTKK